MKNVLLLVPCISIGGLEKVAVTTAEVLSRDYNVSLVYFYRSDVEYKIENNITTACLDTPFSLNPFVQLKTMLLRNRLIKNYKKGKDFDCVISFGKVASITGALTRKKEGCISSLHGYTDLPRNAVARFLDKMIFSRSDSIICVSKALAQDLTKAIGLAEKVKVLYNPFDVSNIEKLSKENCDELKGSPKLFCYGRIVLEKNFELAIKAMKHINKSHHGAVLNILGDGDDKARLQALCTEAGLSDSVNFIESSTNPYKYLAKSDIMLNPSMVEGFGNTIIEAMICKTAIVATDCKVGVRENVSPGSDLSAVTKEIEACECGILCEPSFANDSREEQERKAKLMANAVEMLLSNETLYNSCIEKAAARAAMFDTERYRLELTEIMGC